MERRGRRGAACEASLAGDYRTPAAHHGSSLLPGAAASGCAGPLTGDPAPPRRSTAAPDASDRRIPHEAGLIWNIVLLSPCRQAWISGIADRRGDRRAT